MQLKILKRKLCMLDFVQASVLTVVVSVTLIDMSEDQSKVPENDQKQVFSEKDLVIQQLLASRDSGHNDIKIILEDGELFAMRGILAARSEYFATMFSTTNYRECLDGEVTIPTTVKIMQKIIEFIYSGEIHVQGLTVREAMDFLDVLRRMLMNSAYNFVENILTEHIRKILNQDHTSKGEISLILSYLEKSQKI